MDGNTLLTKKNILIAVVVLLTVTVSMVLVDIFPFRLKSTSPQLSEVATSSSDIDFTFSQPVKSVEEVYINSSPIYNFSINEKVVKVPLLDIGLVKNKVYSIELKGINSTWFSGVIEKLNYTFTPKYIDFNKLSVDEQRRQIEHSNSGQINDPFLNNVFPIIAKDYQIEVVNTGDGETFYLNITFLAEVPDYDKGGVSKQIPNDLAERYKNEVFDIIRKNKGIPENYIIFYSNKYLNDKYGISSHD